MSSAVERFWEKVDKRGACWLWLGTYTTRGNYASFCAKYQGVTFYRGHRFSWHIHNGPIPKGKFVLHKCDNPWCTNPEHLWLGDNDDNMADKIEKGRHRPGEQHGMAKITEKDVEFIRSCDLTAKQLAKRFGLHDGTIYNIRNGKSWRHLLPDYEPQKRWSRQ